MNINFRMAVMMLAVGMVLTSCSRIIDPLIGEGEVTLSPDAARALVDYQARDKPRYFALSQDGQAYYYSFCDDSRCLKQPKSQVVRKCETYSSGVPCKIYASHGKVVWSKESQDDSASSTD